MMTATNTETRRKYLRTLVAKWNAACVNGSWHGLGFTDGTVDAQDAAMALGEALDLCEALTLDRDEARSLAVGCIPLAVVSHAEATERALRAAERRWSEEKP